MSNFNEITSETKKYLLSAPDSQLDKSVKDLILDWSDPPTAHQVLGVLDRCVFGGLASNFVMSVLNMVYDMACKVEGVTHEQVAAKALWRSDER